MVKSEAEMVQPQYRNSFVAMDAAVQYRPPRATRKPRFFGTMTGFIYDPQDDPATDAAHVDPQGRYLVHFPFDGDDGINSASANNRLHTAPVRMARPYGGADEGQYFPIKINTEVLLVFINGDIDRMLS